MQLFFDVLADYRTQLTMNPSGTVNTHMVIMYEEAVEYVTYFAKRSSDYKMKKLRASGRNN